MRAVHVYQWNDGRRAEVAIPRVPSQRPRMDQTVRHEETPFTLNDWKVRYGADGVRETVLFYAERSSPGTSSSASAGT